jgi:hypothetical protein
MKVPKVLEHSLKIMASSLGYSVEIDDSNPRFIVVRLFPEDADTKDS